MDSILKKGKALLSGNKSSSTTTTGGATGQKQDVGDKAINTIQDKFGIDKDHKYDKYEEQGSDLLRGQFEKGSGKKVPDKFSN